MRLTQCQPLCVFAEKVRPKGDKFNDCSAVLLVRYKDTSFIFTGDAEAYSENEIVRSGVSLKVDVLKVGHHGSRTSTSKAFLRAVNPSIAVIMCGQDNRFEHPHSETLKKLQQAGATVYRTDLQGNIVIRSDGDTISVFTQRTVVQPLPVVKQDTKKEATPAKAEKYIGNRNSKIFHNTSCYSAVSMSKVNKVPFRSREEAVQQGYRPCGRCKP